MKYDELLKKANLIIDHLSAECKIEKLSCGIISNSERFLLARKSKRSKS